MIPVESFPKSEICLQVSLTTLYEGGKHAAVFCVGFCALSVGEHNSRKNFNSHIPSAHHMHDMDNSMEVRGRREWMAGVVITVVIYHRNTTSCSSGRTCSSSRIGVNF